MWRLCFSFAILVAFTVSPLAAQIPFEFKLPGYDSNRFRVTEFATGLNYPVGMTELSDGSIAVLTSSGPSFFGSTSGAITRLVDTDQDGVSDLAKILTSRVPGGKASSLRAAGDLIIATGQGTPISIFTVDSELDQATAVAQLQMRYPAGSWLHPHSALAFQRNDEGPEYAVYFQLGSDRNFAVTNRTVQLKADFGLEADLAGDALHLMAFDYDTDHGINNATVRQVATGLRNAAGMDFHPLSGDLYLQDNGIDGFQDPNEPTSADEINLLPKNAAEIVDFGFPDSYTEYRTEKLIGNPDEAPLIAFQPIPNPENGAEAEGANDVSFGPASFPLPLRHGLFVGMHGKFSLGGRSNEENPLVFVDLRDNSYHHAIGVDERNVGHLDGILATEDALYLADISPSGGFGSTTRNSGVIYRIESLYPSIDEITLALRDETGDPHFDMNKDGSVDQSDRIMLIKEINGTVIGDSNLDGHFNSSDLVRVFQIAAYESENFVGDVTWEAGDWNGDVTVNSSDLVFAFQADTFERDTANVMPVPEPSLAVWLIGIFIVRRPRRP